MPLITSRITKRVRSSYVHTLLCILRPGLAIGYLHACFLKLLCECLPVLINQTIQYYAMLATSTDRDGLLPFIQFLDVIHSEYKGGHSSDWDLWLCVL